MSSAQWDHMRAIFNSHLVLTLSLCVLIVGCGLFSKIEKDRSAGELISIIVQVAKNADIESLAARHKDLNLAVVKVLSARMNTWEMTINYKREDIGNALNLLKQDDNITHVQLNHEAEQRND